MTPEARLQRLNAEIEATQVSIRRFEDEGRTYQSDLAAARCYGLLLAREIFEASEAGCTHPVHQPAPDATFGVKTVWVCRDCGDPAPHASA